MGSSGRSARSTLPTGFALLDLDEAVRLRDAGVVKPILLLEGVFEPDDLQIVGEHGLAIVVHDDEQIAMLEAARLPARVPVYLKMNTGMNRLGFAPERYRQVFERLARSTPAAGITLMSHFADADTSRGVAEQLRRFEAAVGPIARASEPRQLRRDAALSGQRISTGCVPASCSTAARPLPTSPLTALGLQPVMTLASELIAVQTLGPGDARRLRWGVRHRPAAANRRGGLRLRRRLSAPRADRHTGARRRRADPDRRPRLDGHAHRRPRSGPRRARRHFGDPVGRGLSCDEVAAAAGTVSYELLCATAARVRQVDR